MLNPTKQLVSIDELETYTEEVKSYVQNVSLTETDVIDILHDNDTSVKISDDSVYEPLETEG